MAITMQETALLGAMAYFIRSGVTIDAVEVGINAVPDDDPTTNWDNLECIKKCAFNAEQKSFGTKTCFDGVNYSEIEHNRTVRDEIMLTTDNMNEILDELTFGTAAAPVEDGSAVSAYANSNRKIYGWLRIDLKRVGTGGSAKTLEAYGYLELESGYEFEAGISEQALKFVHVPGSTLGAPILFKSAT